MELSIRKYRDFPTLVNWQLRRPFQRVASSPQYSNEEALKALSSFPV
jgi:hypothetical protein